MRFEELTLMILAIVCIGSILGIGDYAYLQPIVEYCILAAYCLGPLYRRIKKIRNSDVKTILSLMPSLVVLLTIPLIVPTVDYNTLQAIAIVLVLINILSLRVVKNKFAKRYGVKVDHTENPEETS